MTMSTDRTQAGVHEVGTISANGRDFPVIFDDHSGYFRADVNGRGVSAREWEELRGRVGVEERRSRIKVAVEFVHPETGRKGTVSGLHASTGKPLIAWDGGGRSQNEDVTLPLRPDTDVDTLGELITTHRDATR